MVKWEYKNKDMLYSPLHREYMSSFYNL